MADTYRFEQRFVTREAPGGVSFWPRGWVRHFRAECTRTLPLNFLLPPRLPAGTRVVIFPGNMQPPHAAAGHWGTYYPKRTVQTNSPATYGCLSWLANTLSADAPKGEV